MRTLLLILSISAMAKITQACPVPADSTRPDRSSSNRNDSNFNIFSSYKPVVVTLNDGASFAAMKMDGLFSRFQVIDERPDTARIGIHMEGRKRNSARNRQIVFARAVNREIAHYLNTHFTRPQAPYTCLVVLRSLWLTDANYIKEELMKAPGKRFEKTKIRLKAEIYAVRDSIYIPLIRFDSLQVSRSNNYSHFGRDLADMLNDMADSSSIRLTERRESGRLISFDDIRAFNQSRFDMPICRDSVLRKGVYNSFEEFRDNTPTGQDVEIKKEQDNIIMYIKETGGRSYYCHNAWGYCDGKDIYIMKDGALHPAWREGKAWYFFGKATLLNIMSDASDPAIPPAGAVIQPDPFLQRPLTAGNTAASLAASTLAYSLLHDRDILSRLRVFAIDMDSGIVY